MIQSSFIQLSKERTPQVGVLVLLCLSFAQGCGRGSLLGLSDSSTGSGGGGGGGIAAPTSLSYTLSAATYVNSQNIPNNVPTTDGVSVTYSIVPDLTADTGLTFNTSTGIISGTASSTHASTTYTVTATNAGGNITADLVLGVAAGFVVTSTADTSDFATADGFCDTNDSAGDGPCTLRAAAEQANFTGGTQAIFLPAGTITVDTTMITLGSAGLGTLTITGQGVGNSIISGGNTAPRVFNKTNATNLTISEVTMSGGRDTANGGFINNNSVTGSLTLRNCTLSGNQITNNGVGGGAVGGGMAAGAMTTIDNCTITGNSAPDYAAAVGSWGTLNILNSTISNNTLTNAGGQAGGAVWTEGILNITNSTFSSNSGGAAAGGGAIYVSSTANVTITGSTFTSNTSPNAGGAIYQATNSFITVTNTTFTDNTSTNAGGAIYIVGGATGTADFDKCTFLRNISDGGGGLAINSGDITMVNTTFSENESLVSGGAVATEGTGNVDVTIRQSTIANNECRTGGLGGDGGGIFVGAGDIVRLVQTIVAKNLMNGVPDNCEWTGATLTTGSYNLSDEAAADCNLNTGGGTPDIASANVSQLASTASSNGGSVQTVAINASSFPGVDAIPAGSCYSLEDAREDVRPTDGNGDTTAACDIGAFEL